LAISINADKSMQVTDMMMSVMNKTPASMKSLQEGLKQSNAGFANFATSTSKTGIVLEDYKMKLMETELAILGSQASIGRMGKSLPFSA
jgi:hypothetical protein